MPLARRALRALTLTAAIVVGLYALYLLFGWLALPHLLQSQSQRYIAEKSGHHLSMELPEYDPFRLSLRIPNLKLEQPDGKPLLAIGEIFVDLSAASIFQRAYVFDGIRLSAPQVDVALLEDGSLNWSPLIEALKSKEPQPPAALPRLDMRSFLLNGGRIDFSDRKAGFATRIDPVELELADVSSVADKEGRYQVVARTAQGAQLAWQGQVDLTPPSLSGDIAIADLDLAKLEPYLKRALPATPSGIAALSTDYRASYADGKLALRLENAQAAAKDLRIPLPHGATLAVAAVGMQGGRYDLASQNVGLVKLEVEQATLALPRPAPPQKLGNLALEDLRADLAKRSAAVARIALTNGELKATRSADGRIDLAEALAQLQQRPAAQPGAAKPSAAKTDAAQPAAPPWHFNADKLELAGFTATLRDQSVTPPAELVLENIGIAADKVSDDLNAPLAVRAGLVARGGGTFKADGKLVPAGPSADLQVRLADLPIKLAQPYLGAVAKLTVTSGKLSIDGRASYDKQDAAFKGGFDVRDLRLDEAGTKNRFLVWKSLVSRSVEATPAKLDVRELKLDGLDASLLIAKDKTVNLSHILRSDRPTKPAAAAEPARKPAPAFVANIARLRVTRAELDFADESLALPFGTRIHHLRGNVTGLSTRPGASGLLELEGEVDDYGLARAAGQINLFDPTDFADVNVVFRNVEMTRLTPYSATFLGRKITSGKLSLDLVYKFKKRQVEGDNKVVMDRLTLGERVESPQAKNLPLDLAIAILQDSDGRIELGLPVSGSLDDPQFSYGGIIWKAIVNVVTKIATAPFRALASMFGGGEKIDSIAFEAGRGRLTPPEREKLVRIAGMLNKRPSLALTLHGVWSEADRVALQDRQLRRALAERAGHRLEANEDAGPLSTQDPKIQSALEGLFADRFGGAELAALKEGFRAANPGQLQESAAGKVMSRLTNLLRKPRALGADEIAQLKGADFHAVLFERLREREAMPDERLQALAQTRGQFAADALKEASAPAARVALGAPEKIEATGKEIPLKVEVGTAK